MKSTNNEEYARIDEATAAHLFSWVSKTIATEHQVKTYDAIRTMVEETPQLLSTSHHALGWPDLLHIAKREGYLT